MFIVQFNERERDTILAALREREARLDFCKPSDAELDEIDKIAANGRKGAAAVLSPWEIDALCERINCAHEAVEQQMAEALRQAIPALDAGADASISHADEFAQLGDKESEKAHLDTAEKSLMAMKAAKAALKAAGEAESHDR